jgi:uncharacterized Tic20 family protein
MYVCKFSSHLKQKCLKPKGKNSINNFKVSYIAYVVIRVVIFM